MSVTAASLTLPVGPLASGLLAAIGAARVPAVSGASVAAGNAAAANAQVAGAGFAFAKPADQLAAGVAWAAAGALEERAQQILSDAVSGGADGASYAFSSAQAAELRKAAAEQRGTYAALLASGNTAAGAGDVYAGEVRTIRAGSRSVTASVAW